jgi:hypothetical protein
MTSNDRERITFERNQALAASKTLSSFTLPAGEYDFPFRILLASDTAETITGVNHEYHSYKVQGIIERHFGKDFVIARPLRVYRLSELETDHSWPGYSEVRVDFSSRLRNCNNTEVCSPLKIWMKTFITIFLFPIEIFPLAQLSPWNSGLHHCRNTQNRWRSQLKSLRDMTSESRQPLRNQYEATFIS